MAGMFKDDFNDTSLDPLKWTVESLGGHLATYSLSGGFLNIDVPGGSCGACGIADGARFKPRVDPLIGDFEMVISAEEIERLSRDRTRPLSDLQLLLTGTSTELGIFVIGDATNNQGNPGHRIVAYYRDGNSVVYPLIKDLTIGQYSAFQFKIRRVKGIAYLAYKIAPDTTWTEAAVPASFPSNAVFIPSIVVASGDGGGTGTNSSYKLKIDSVAISK